MSLQSGIFLHHHGTLGEGVWFVFEQCFKVEQLVSAALHGADGEVEASALETTIDVPTFPMTKSAMVRNSSTFFCFRPNTEYSI